MSSPRETGRRELLLALLSGALLGIAFPPLHSGVLAAIALVPFFFCFEGVGDYPKALRLSYVTFFVFNLITLYWTGGFTHARDPYLMAAGGCLILAHPFFFFPPVAAWLFLRKKFGSTLSLSLFPFLWVSFEYLHSLADISFPWLTLGNTQTEDLPAIQIASITGVYGISFWLLWLNVFVYYILSRLRSEGWKPRPRRTLLLLAGLAAAYLLPRVYGTIVLNSGEGFPGEPFRVGIVQPDIDPFEKWQERPLEQLQLLRRLTDQVAGAKPALILWPETAVPFYVLDPRNGEYFESMKRQVDSLGIPLLAGIPDISYYPEGSQVPGSSKTSLDGRRYDNYNSSMLLQPHDPEIQKYAKMLLVPFAERVPFSEALSFLNAMQWNFGLGGWGIGKDKTVFRVRTGGSGPDSGRAVSFSNFICYESIYPGFVASFVRNGAEFLTVITNDSWWGNTSGAYQHVQFAILRAVENRRWIVQCANGGVSCLIDPAGHLLQQTEMFTRETLAGEIIPRRELTFYSRTGDWFAQICLVLSSFYLAAGVGQKIYSALRGK
jgi:apolipoprotein N-acyltransferase